MADHTADNCLAREITEDHMPPIQAIAQKFGWTEARALRQIVEDWAITFDWQPEPRRLLQNSEYD